MRTCAQGTVNMDAKDLRTESALSERNNDGSKYSQSGGIALHCDRNKSYQDIGSNSLGKVDVPSARPCAVIGPDRIVPPVAHNDAYLKKGPPESWSCMDNAYLTRRPPEYPHKLSNFQNPRNISPRQTFQENMQRILVPPSYNSVKVTEDTNYNQMSDRSNALPKNIKINVPSEAKFCDVPYTVYSSSSEQKNARNLDMCSVNPNLLRTAPQGWPPGNVNVRAPRPYGAPEIYQYQDYPSCAGPRPVVPRPNRTGLEEPGYVYADSFYHHQDGNIRFKPYPTVKERFQQQRYEYISNYASSFHPPQAFPTHKYDLQKPGPPHPYPPYPPIKYIDRTPEPSLESYQRNQQGPYNIPVRNQVIHPNYGNVLGGNCPPNKMHSYPPDAHMKPVVPNKLPYDNSKGYIEYENGRPKIYPHSDNYVVNEMGRMHPMKSQVIVPGYAALNMHNMPPNPYYKKDHQIKNYEYHHLRSMDPSLNIHNPLTRHPPVFSPNTLAISPTGSSTSDTLQTIGASQEDCGYVSQSSTASARSLDTGINRIPNEYVRKYYDSRYGPIVRTLPTMSKSELNASNNSKEKKNIDVRQFLSMWNEGDEESEANNAKEVIKPQSNRNENNFGKPHELLNHKSQEQLYVLGLVNVPSEELAKYEHIQKVSKLPENIKGYNHIELLNQFEEAIESSNMINYKRSSPKEFPISKSITAKHVSGGLPTRPLSPLDVEAKISQSVIHKEVGCNFEIKPCSPKMLNVEVATPVQNILCERSIEKVSNPVMLQSPRLTALDENINCDIMKTQDHRMSINNEPIRIPSCKMVKTPFSNNSAMDSVKTSYTLQDLESNPGLCFASLPRLDNDIELNFPEVNQQFINANKADTSVPSPLRDLPTLDVLDQTENQTKDHLNINSLYQEQDVVKSPCADIEKESSKLSKYRKVKVQLSEAKENINAVRTDSVIIKNPENAKNVEEKSLFSPNCLMSPSISDIQQAPINLTAQENNMDSRGHNNSKKLNDDSLEIDSSVEFAIDFSLDKNSCNNNIASAILKDREGSEMSTSKLEANHLINDDDDDFTGKPLFTESVHHTSINHDTIGENTENIVTNLKKSSDTKAAVKKSSNNILDNTSLLASLPVKENLPYIDNVNVKDNVQIQRVNNFNDVSNKSVPPIEFVDAPASELLTIHDKDDDHYSMNIEKNVIAKTRFLEAEANNSFIDSEINNLNDCDCSINKRELTTDIEKDSACERYSVDIDKNTSASRRLEKLNAKDHVEDMKTRDFSAGKTELIAEVSENINNDDYSMDIDKDANASRQLNSLYTSLDEVTVDNLKNHDCSLNKTDSINEIEENKNIIPSTSAESPMQIDQEFNEVPDTFMVDDLQSSNVDKNIYQRDTDQNKISILNGHEKEIDIHNDLSAEREISLLSPDMITSNPNQLKNAVPGQNTDFQPSKNIITCTSNDISMRLIEEESHCRVNPLDIQEQRDAVQILEEDTATKYIIKPFTKQKRRIHSVRYLSFGSKSMYSPWIRKLIVYCEGNTGNQVIDNNDVASDDSTLQTDISIKTESELSTTITETISSSSGSVVPDTLSVISATNTTKTVTLGDTVTRATDYVSIETDAVEAANTSSDTVLTTTNNASGDSEALEADNELSSTTARTEMECKNVSYEFNLKTIAKKNCASTRDIISNDMQMTTVNHLNNSVILKGDRDVFNEEPPIEYDVENTAKSKLTNEAETKNVKNKIDEIPMFSNIVEDASADIDIYGNQIDIKSPCNTDELDQHNNRHEEVKTQHFHSEMTNECYKQIIYDDKNTGDNLSENESKCYTSDQNSQDQLCYTKVIAESDESWDINETISENKGKKCSTPTENTDHIDEQSIQNLPHQLNSTSICNNDSSAQTESHSDSNNEVLHKCNNQINGKNEVMGPLNTQVNVGLADDCNRQTDSIDEITEKNNDQSVRILTNSPIEVVEDGQSDDITAELLSHQDNKHNSSDIRHECNDEVMHPTNKVYYNSEVTDVDSSVLPEYDEDAYSKFSSTDTKRRTKSLKRSLSDSALNIYNDRLIPQKEENIPFIWPFKRKKNIDVNNDMLAQKLCNIIQSNRRNSVSSFYNEENVSFCILIDDSCILTEEEEENDGQDRVCYTEEVEDCSIEPQVRRTNDDADIGNVTDNLSDPHQDTNWEYSESYIMQGANEKLEDSWVGDVACVETVVSDDIAEDIEISGPMSPVENLSDNDESGVFSSCEHTDKVKYIYGDKMCTDDAQFVESLYNTPQMDVNKRLVQRGALISGEYYDNDSLEKILSEPNDSPYVSGYSESLHRSETTEASVRRKDIVNVENIPGLEHKVNALNELKVGIAKHSYDNDKLGELLNETQDDTVHSCESSIDNVFSYKESEDSTNYVTSSSPEVSSTTSEDKNSGILLKITNYKGARISQINNVSRESKRPCCKFTEDKDYVQTHPNFSTNRPLLTKAAQKYIPPLKESIRDLKVKLSLPQHSLMKLKQLKKSKDEPKLSHHNIVVPKMSKKPKPKFEDVLKSIDEIQFKMHKEKTKKSKKSIPKVVIKKTENGSHYASTSSKTEFNPDLTGRKWQPWVFIEKNNFIDKMALKRKTKAIYSHRKRSFVLAEKFQKYKAVNSAKFVIAPPISDCPSTGLKYTIRLKHK